ncbi:GntR family transcriptional regulator, partial [Paenibacillus forsythiae]
MNKISGNEQHPLFRQVYEYMTARIDRGEWRANDKLPSVRLLAEELRIHRLTVFKAYQRLKEDGRVYVRDKSGYYVAPVAAAGKCDSTETDLGYRMRNRLSDIQRMPVKYQFSQALIDPNLLPNLYLSDYVKEVFDRYPKVMGTYSGVEGDHELR